ncbi:MAG: amino acid adenylation domain-containing protein, partial [Myxococcota bacterium]
MIPTVISRFESQADRTPDAPAATFQGATLSYAQLDARANGLAATLRERGVGPDVVVAVCVPRSLEMAVAVLGVLKAGGAYVPLDPAYPRERLNAMLDDARVEHVVGHSATAELFAGRNAILMDNDAPYPRRERLPIVAGLSHLAYVIFTSGSTGRPKGVAMIHHPLANLIQWQLEDSKVGVGERTLQFSPLAFDVSFQELFGTWCAGGELMLVDEALRVDTVRLLRFMKEESIARVFMPFIAMQALAEIVPSLELTPSSLREMITAGEQLQVTPQLVRFFESVPGVTLANHYGPSETHVVTAMTLAGAPSSWPKLPSIGKALPNVTTPILDDKQKPVPAGEVGELYLGGVHLARGYLHRPELTSERFVTVNGERLYKTGDLARLRPDGEIDFLGRADGQVKIRGHRVELGEVEIAVTEHPKVRQAAAAVRDGRLIAYMVGDDDGTLAAQVREQLAGKLPAYMVPTSFVVLAELPKTPSGKIDRKSLPEPPRVRPDLATPWVAPEGPVEAAIAQRWADILKIDTVGRDDNFFDLGGNSLLAVRAIAELRESQGVDVPVVKLYEQPTVRGLATAVAGGSGSERQPAKAKKRQVTAEPIAIVGMAARYPGARDLDAFWKNLEQGVESIGRFAEHELPPAHRGLPDYVPARGLLEGVDQFDAAFFGVTPGEASVLDPQQRLLLELAWEALEHAGHAPERIAGSVGVFAGTHVNTYFQNNLFKRPEIEARIGAFNVMVASEKDYVATRIAHRLSLTGPAISVHTACSTSLVAIAQAVDSLHLGHCDVALAGGAAVTVPQKVGHVFADGGIMSKDGSTRSFDAQGSGTVFSDGGGMVVLKRLSDAERDGDTIYALLVGTALNNDGGEKASFMAPSSSGQSAVVSLALDNAGVSARDIDYVETHGTATPIGDPIEVDGLTKAYRKHTDDVGYCGLGSVKTNIGHTVAAAGVAGVIKTALALHHQLIPASLHFEKPNPAIDFQSSPFTVVAKAKRWPRGERTRLAGVSSFGVGGTNAHVIMREAPVAPARATSSRSYVLPLSARNAEVLGTMTNRLAAALADDSTPIADVAATLALGRRAFAERRALVASTRDEALTAIKAGEARRIITRTLPPKAAHVVFMFPGQGSQTVGMGKRLYERFGVFRAVVDDCAERLKSHLGRDLRELMWPAASVAADTAAATLRDTAVAQSALFTIELATAKLWMDFGVVPTAMVGHSVGEFVAACLSGVFSLDDGLRLVATRGRLMAGMPPGSMMSVRMAEAD